MLHNGASYDKMKEDQRERKKMNSGTTAPWTEKDEADIRHYWALFAEKPDKLVDDYFHQTTLHSMDIPSQV
jgi:hypothetical protein